MTTTNTQDNLNEEVKAYCISCTEYLPIKETRVPGVNVPPSNVPICAKCIIEMLEKKIRKVSPEEGVISV
jgi:hypothetical protein